MARLDSNAFPALSESTVAKLHSRGIFTVYDFMLQTCEDLMKKTGLNFKVIISFYFRLKLVLLTLNLTVFFILRHFKDISCMYLKIRLHICVEEIER